MPYEVLGVIQGDTAEGKIWDHHLAKQFSDETGLPSAKFMES
jgi:hypothetical protein